MVSPFNPETFSLPEERVELLPPQYSQQGATSEFSEEFGLNLVRMPIKGMWLLVSKKRDLVITFSTLLREETGANSVAFYRANFADFKKAVILKKHVELMIHVEDLDPAVLFPGLRIAEIIQERNGLQETDHPFLYPAE